MACHARNDDGPAGPLKLRLQRLMQRAAFAMREAQNVRLLGRCGLQALDPLSHGFGKVVPG